MTRIGSVTFKPDFHTMTGLILNYQHAQIVREDGALRMASFKHAGNEYLPVGDGKVRLQSLRYERVA